MTNERNKLDRDAEVSRTYRSLANETAPERLNRQVLSMAAKGESAKVRGSYASMFWMRPVAWAATVGLCLVIVLEVTQNPVSNVENLPQSGIESLREEFTPTDNDTLDAPRERDELGTASNRQDIAKPEPASGAIAERKPGFQSAPAASAESTSDLAQAEEARKTVKRFPASASMALEKAEFESEPACDSIERRSPEEWLLCIKRLRDMGYDKEADQEYAAFALKYPSESEPVEPNR